MIANNVSVYDLFTMDRVEEYRYVDVDGGIKIIGYSGLREYIEIPESIDGKTVVAIGCEDVVYPGARNFKLLIPNTVHTIDPKTNPTYEYSWYGGIYLKPGNENLCIENNALYSSDKKTLLMDLSDDDSEVVIPEGVESIGAYAFFKQRKNVKLPTTLKRIGDYAFGDTNHIIKIPESVEWIGNYIAEKYELSENNKNYTVVDSCVYTMDKKVLVQCFDRRRNEIVIPDTVEIIRPYAFDGVPVTKLDLGLGVLSIGEFAFASSEIKTIRIPDQLVELDEKAFNYSTCNSVRVRKKNQHFYSDGICFFIVHSNGEKSLLKCFKKDVTEYIIPEDTVYIAPKAFCDCIKMNKLIFPKRLKSFSENCLVSYNFSVKKCSVKEIMIPEMVEHLDITFKHYDYIISQDNRNYFVEDGILYHRLEDGLEIVLAQGVSGVLSIRDDVVRIKSWAFSSCNEISKIICGESLKMIEPYAFSDGWNSNDIQEIIFNEGLEYIDYLAFSGCKVGKLYIPASVRYMCISAFNKSETVEYDVDKSNPYYTSVNGCLFDRNMLALKYVPKLLNIKKFVVPESVTEIGKAFRSCKNIEEIVIPKQVTCIWRDSLDCSAKDIYVNGDIKYFNYGGVNFFDGVTIHTDAGSGAAQYVEKLRERRPGARVFLAINGEPFLSKEFEVRVEGRDATIVRVINEKEKLIIPSEIGGYSVTKLSDHVFAATGFHDEKIHEIIIPDSVIDIGKNAFIDRNALMKVSLPKSIKKISEGMFMRCSNLEELIIPDGVEEIEAGAFYGCEKIRKIYFPTSIKKISDWILAYPNGDYKDLDLNPEIEYIVERGSYAEVFLKAYKPDTWSCDQLNVKYADSDDMLIDEIDVQDNLDETVQQGHSIEAKCKSLYKEEHVDIVDNILYEYHGTDEKCHKIPEGIEEIGKYALNKPYRRNDPEEDYLEEIILPSSVKKIGQGAFSDREKLKRINIPNGVEYIEVRAFSNCISLESLYIPASVKSIAVVAFPEYKISRDIVPNFSFIDVDSENEVYTSIEGVLYSKDKKNLIEVPAAFNQCEFVVPEFVETIDRYAFYGNPFIKNVILTKNVSKIEDNAFAACKNLKTINLENVTEIGEWAFYKCESLMDIELHVSEIKKAVFSECKNLDKVILKGTHIISEDAFYHCGIKEIDLPDGLIEINDEAFCGCHLTKVVVPKTVIKTGHDCFSGCSEIIVYDSIDPEAAVCTAHRDTDNGYPNSVVGFIGTGEPNAMWQCAANHEWIDHEIIVKSAETDEIKYKVWMGADPSQRYYYCTLTSSWGRNATFNFKEVDYLFSKIKGLEHKIRVAANRIRYPEMLSDMYKKGYVDYLKRYGKEFVKLCIDLDDLDALVFFESFELVKKKDIDALIRYATKQKSKEISAYLRSYKKQYFKGNSTKRAKKTVAKSKKSGMDKVDSTSKNDALRFDRVKSIDFQDKIFVLVGFGKDEEKKITEIIKTKGGNVKSTTVVKTAYLVVKEGYTRHTVKYNKALELKEKGQTVYIIDSKMFYELC